MRTWGVFGALILLAGCEASATGRTSRGPKFFDDDPPAEDGTSPKKKTPPAADQTPASSTEPGAGEEDGAGDETPDAPTDVSWEGTLASTTAVAFGGAPYCDYRVTFKNLKMKLAISQSGEIKSSEVTGQMIEEALPGCVYQTIPPNVHTFRFLADDGANTPTDDLDVSLTGAKSNSPQSVLSFVGAKDTNNTIVGSIRIHRTDIAPPLDWTVVANIRLTPAAAAAAN